MSDVHILTSTLNEVRSSNLVGNFWSKKWEFRLYLFPSLHKLFEFGFFFLFGLRSSSHCSPASLISRSLLRIVKGLLGSFVKGLTGASIDLIVSSGDRPGEFFFFHLAQEPLSLNASGLGIVIISPKRPVLLRFFPYVNFIDRKP